MTAETTNIIIDKGDWHSEAVKLARDGLTYLEEGNIMAADLALKLAIDYIAESGKLP